MPPRMSAAESDALRRARKLLALAQSPNPHEAAVAAARAQVLIERHRLQVWLDAEAGGEDGEAIEDARDEPLERSKRLRKWKVALAGAVAEANGCFAYTLTGPKERALILVGRASDRASVAELYQWLVKRIEWLSARHGEGESRKWHEAFRFGVVSAVANRLREAKQEARESLEPGALVRVDPAEAAHKDALERFVSSSLKLGRGRGVRVDAEAFAAGRAASADIELP